MKKNINFIQLWERLKNEAEICGDEGMRSVLMNHERRKEYICRKLGVISETDVKRISTDLKLKQSKIDQ